MKDRWLEVLKYSDNERDIIIVLLEIKDSDDELLSILAKFAIMQLSVYGEPERQVKKWWRFWK